MLPVTFQFIIAMVAYAINERMLTLATGRTRIAFTPEQRRCLALKGKQLTPEERNTCCQIVRTQTILAWFRQLAARPVRADSGAEPKLVTLTRNAS
jgi:hypothetical protein